MGSAASREEAFDDGFPNDVAIGSCKSASPERAAGNVSMSVAPINCKFAADCVAAWSASAARLAMLPSSWVRRVSWPLALEAHAAGEQHEVNDASGGSALPRSITPMSVVAALTKVMSTSAVNLCCLACDV